MLHLKSLTFLLSAVFVLLLPGLGGAQQCVRGTVYLDENSSLTNDEETGLPNAILTLYAVEGEFQTAVETDAEGNYEICEVPFGTYRLTARPDIADEADKRIVSPLPDDLLEVTDFGEAFVSFPALLEDRTGSIAGRVVVDFNENDAEDAPDFGINGAFVEVTGGDGFAQSIATGPGGGFVADFLPPGAYNVRVASLPPPFVLPPAPLGQSLMLAAGDNVRDVLFLDGFDLGPETQAVIAGRAVFEYPLDEPVTKPSQGLTVTLADAEGRVVAETRTAMGHYQFAVQEEGDYVVTVEKGDLDLEDLTPSSFAVAVADIDRIAAPLVIFRPEKLISCGQSIVTCFGGFNSPAAAYRGGNLLNPAGHVLGIVDVRKANSVLGGTNWDGVPMVPLPFDAAADLGQIFGLAQDATGHIYVSATTMYGDFASRGFGDPSDFGPAGPGGVYKIDIFTGAVSQVSLPNNGSGLGNLCYSPDHEKLYVSNFADGAIHQIDVAGGAFTATGQVYDPTLNGSTYGGTFQDARYAPLGERIWGMAYKEDQLIFGVWNEDFGRVSPTFRNQLWTVDVDAAGTVVANSEALLIEMPHFGSPAIGTLAADTSGFSNPVSDIEITQNGELLLAERTMAYDRGTMSNTSPFNLGTDPANWSRGFGYSHLSRVFRLDLASGDFRTVYTGNLTNGGVTNGLAKPRPPLISANSAGGVSVGYAGLDDENELFGCEGLIWSTGDALRFPGYDFRRGECMNLVNDPDRGNATSCYQAGLNDRVYGIAGNPYFSNSPFSADPNYIKRTSVYVDLDGIFSRYPIKSEYGDIDVFQCPCERPATCSVSSGFSTTNGEEEDDCCPALTYTNSGADPVHAIGFRLLNGLTFDAAATTFPAGYTALATSSSTRVIAQSNLAALPNNIDSVLNFCLLDVLDPTQQLVVDYLADDLLTILCSDTLTFECPVQNYCLEVAADTLVCPLDGNGVLLQMDVLVPNNSFTDSVGLVKVMVPGLLPVRYNFAPPLGAGQGFRIDTLLPPGVLVAGDSLKVLVTAHEGPAERLCCFADSLCLPIPECAVPCDSLLAELEPVEERGCNFDLILTNTFTSDPTLITSVGVNIVSGPDPDFGGFNLVPAAPGWDLTTGGGGSFTLNPTGGAMPLGVGQRVFQFEISESFSPDSTYVEVVFLAGMDTLCRDTLVAICPGCITIPQDSVVCSNPGQLYTFNFVNHSPYPVNAVQILPTDPPGADVLLNPQTHYLGQMVPVGGTFSGTIPVEFIDDGDGEVCFDVILRQLVEGEVPINCCFATVCVEVPECPQEVDPVCETGPGEDNPECPISYNPVCGCDGMTYVNRCFATAAGIATWTGGACPGTPIERPDFEIEAFEPSGGQLIVSAAVPTTAFPGDASWYGFILQRQRRSDGTWWSKGVAFDAFPAISLVDDSPVAGPQTYRIVAVSLSGQPYVGAEATFTVPSLRPIVNVAPNPATNEVLLMSDHHGPADVDLMSLTGRRAITRPAEFTDRGVPFKLGKQPPGVYTILVRFEDGTQAVRRIVIE